MNRWTLGLRSKAMLALLLASLIALVPAAFMGTQVVASVQDYFGQAYARNLTDLSRQRIQAPILMDLVLSERLASTQLLLDWLQDEENPEKQAAFFREAEGYATALRGQTYFAISAQSGNYYFNDPQTAYSEGPRYQLNPDDPNDAWFFNLLDDIGEYNINVNPDVQLGTTRVWLNLPIRLNGDLLGIAGTGLDLTAFLRDFITTNEPGVTPMIIDQQGFVQAHPNPELIAFGSSVGLDTSNKTLHAMLSTEEARMALESALTNSRAQENVALLPVVLDGQSQLLAIAYMPELRWYLVTAVDLSVAQTISGSWWVSIVIGFGVMLVLLLIIIAVAVERLLIHPLSHLQASATQITQGNYNVALPKARNDEIGDLSRAFGAMVKRVQNHTAELEARVQQRTQELENSNREIAQFNKMVNDSIDYASLIQQAILPFAKLNAALGEQQFVVWQPRDVVGGDFYFFHGDQDAYLIGLVDCAGHGVPGALMTMLARAAFDQAVRDDGIDDPAAVLHDTDEALRNMLQDLDLPRALATNMDAGLLYVNVKEKAARYAGAKIQLYMHSTQGVEEIKGARRALVARKPGDYVNSDIQVPDDATFYLTSDGYLDQAGGELGYGMGSSGFKDIIAQHSHVSLPEQGQAVLDALSAYQGDYPQRDDICVLGIRLKTAD